MSTSTRAGSRRRGRDAAPDAHPRTPLPSMSATHPAWLVAALIAAAFCLRAVAYPLSTSDVWQHLLVGKAIWQLGGPPAQHLWSWPSFGQPEVLPSWLFRWALWPWWEAGGIGGLQAWRGVTTLAAFGIGLWTARLLGARGVLPLFVIAVAALSYRARAQVRPETLVAVLLALQVALLERRRRRGGGALALVAIAWIWANVHLSFYLGWALTGIHLVAELLPGGRGTAATDPAAGGRARFDRAPLAAVLAACVAVSFANPSGARALWQPVEYLTTWRHLGIYRAIPELQPLLAVWPKHLSSGLPFLVVGWPLLVAGRALARRFDPAEAMTCALFLAHTLFNQRFSGAFAVVLVPYLSRDLSELAGGLRLPAALGRPSLRAAIAAVAMTAASLPGWADRRFPLRVGFVDTVYPSAACDFIERHGIAGRTFNPFYLGGYLVWRFWPQRDRLPFVDIHATGSPEDLEWYARCFSDPAAWESLMRKHRFDVALLDGHQEWVANDHLMDLLDRDRNWALVFRDDAAALYLRRDGRNAAQADSLGYALMPGGAQAFAALGGVVARDTTLRRILRLELERAAASSPLAAQAHSYLANLDFLDQDRRAARRHLDAALAVEPTFLSAHRRIGYLWLAEGAWDRAIAEFERELALGGPPLDEFMRLGEAYERKGDRRRAAHWYRRELAIHAANDEARAALARTASAR